MNRHPMSVVRQTFLSAPALHQGGRQKLRYASRAMCLPHRFMVATRVKMLRFFLPMNLNLAGTPRCGVRMLWSFENDAHATRNGGHVK